MMSLRIRIISVVVGLIVLAFISFLVRRRRLYNIYSISWFFIGLAFIYMGVMSQSVETLAAAIGIYSPAAAILVIAIFGILAIILHLSIIVTEQHRQIRQFEKELALLKKHSPKA